MRGQVVAGTNYKLLLSVADAKNTKKDLEVTVYGARHAAPADSCVSVVINRLPCGRLPARASPLRAPCRRARGAKLAPSTSESARTDSSTRRAPGLTLGPGLAAQSRWAARGCSSRRAGSPAARRCSLAEPVARVTLTLTYGSFEGSSLYHACGQDTAGSAPLRSAAPVGVMPLPGACIGFWMLGCLYYWLGCCLRWPRRL